MANKVASAKRKVIKLEYPLGGLNRSIAYQKQPPYTAPFAVNVRACDYTKRNRGGSRPGFGKHEFVEMGSGNPVNMLEQMQYVRGDGFTVWSEPFAGTSLGSDWTAVSGYALPSVAQTLAYGITYNTTGRAIHDTFDYFDASKPHSVEMTISPYKGWHVGSYYLFMRTTAYLPYTNGVEVLVNAETQGTLTITVTEYVAASASVIATATVSYSQYIAQTKLIGLISGTTFTLYCNGVSVATGTVSGSLTGTQVGFGIDNTTIDSSAIIAGFVCKYFKTQLNQTSTSLLMAAANGTLYKRGQVDMQAITSSCTLNTYDYLQGANFYKKLYISDHGPVKASGTDGVMSSGGVLSAASITDWTTKSIVAADDVVEITNVQGAAIAMTSKITTIAAGGLTLTQPAASTGTVKGAPTYNATAGQSTIVSSTGTFTTYMIGLSFKFTTSTNTFTIAIVTDASTVVVTGNASGETAGQTYSISQATGAGTCTYKVHAAPKVYDADTDTLTIWNASVGMGSVPTGCTMACLWRGRIVMADGTNQWYMSRQLDPNDWNYGANAGDGGRAVSSQNANAGQVGEPVNALVPCSTQYMIMGCTNSLWIFNGDPAYGGQIANLSRTVGILSAKAWCRVPSGEVIFMSRDGLYSVTPQVGAVPQTLSREKLPLELLNVDPQHSRVLLAYDKFDVGIHIYLSTAGGETTHYWFDLSLKAFFPMTMPEDLQPASILEFMSDEIGRSQVLLGGQDGYLRYPADEFETDDGTPFDSSITIGPFRLGGDDFNHGLLCELWGTLGKESGPVDWSVIVGDSCEESTTNTALATGTWLDDGLNYHEHPACRGGGASVVISNGATGERWGIESIGAIVEQTGPQVKL